LDGCEGKRATRAEGRAVNRRAKRASKRGVATRKRQPPTQKIIDALCLWFDHNARDLPWRKRRHRNSYAALVAETMLQQTQVARVIDAYVAFIRRFPNAMALAAADEQDVLAMWQGLGYYRRARNLHRAAKAIMSDFGGKVPRSVEQLLQLPGVGRYTAGAIASIVHGSAAPIVDGNVQRVLMRWHGRIDRHGGRSALKWSWLTADKLVCDAARPGVLNEAMMELGAVICTPRNPRCGECPVRQWCEARRKNLQNRIPSAGRRPAPRSVHHHAVAITCDGKVLVEQRDGTSNGSMWAAMWQVPTIESDRRLSEIEIKRALPIKVNDLVASGGFDHHTTHRRIRFHVYWAKVNSRKGTWRGLDEIAQLPMSNAQRRILQLLKHEMC
jgi:A/G-specific adenine glycosylase